MNGEHKGMKPEIQDLILDSARLALKMTGETNEAPPSGKTLRKLNASFEAMTRAYSGRHPIPDLLKDMQSTTEELTAKEAGAEAGATASGNKNRAATTMMWTQATKKCAEEAEKRHLRIAAEYFEKEHNSAGAEELCKAVNCHIATIAAQRGWPHQTTEDIDNAVTALGAGTLPHEGENLSELLAAAPELGDELNSAFIAAKSQPSLATDTVFHSMDEKFCEDATFFAQRTIELANLLAGECR